MFIIMIRSDRPGTLRRRSKGSLAVSSESDSCFFATTWKDFSGKNQFSEPQKKHTKVGFL